MPQRIRQELHQAPGASLSSNTGLLKLQIHMFYVTELKCLLTWLINSQDWFGCSYILPLIEKELTKGRVLASCCRNKMPMTGTLHEEVYSRRPFFSLRFCSGAHLFYSSIPLNRPSKGARQLYQQLVAWAITVSATREKEVFNSPGLKSKLLGKHLHVTWNPQSANQL